LFEAASWAGIAIDSTCGARGTCHKCRVRVRENAISPTSEDAHAFTGGEVAAGWRLACRAALSEDSPAAIELEVPPLSTTPKAALLGRGRHVVLSPSVQKRRVLLPRPSLEDQASDLERLVREFPDLDLDIPLEALRALPSSLRAEGFEATAVVVGNRLVTVEPGDTTDTLYGLAVDLGTTTVVCALIDLHSGAITAVASALNAQERFGSDVISRISHAVVGAHQLAELRMAGLATLNALVEKVCAKADIESTSIYHAIVAGNSTMLHVVLGVDPGTLSLTPFTPAFRASVELAACEFGIAIHRMGRVQTFPLLGAYVGADIVAGILATGVGRDGEVSLFIDIGTNGEVVLAAGGRIVATSAPAGPAFEGAEIRCGMRAVDGAIEAVRIGDEVELDVLGGVAPKGICGSGLADAVAGLLGAGLLDPTGRLKRSEEVAGHPLADRMVQIGGTAAFRLADGIELTQQDIRALQFAKGAIASGVQTLMEDLGVGSDDLDEVLLAGSFGTYIDPASARAIGLIPPVDLDRVSPVGNSSLEGAKIALLSFREQQIGIGLAERVEYVELSGDPNFNDTFVSTLAFPAPEAVG
jgi:uncharacterized 2Fe-2S/4Fe-4S cluster protein (DUF4445 family)